MVGHEHSKIGRVFFITIMVITTAAMIFGMLSCSPSAKLKQSKKRLIKVELNNPELLAAYCAKKYVNVTATDTLLISTTDTVLQSDTSIVYDTATKTYLKTITRRYHYWHTITKTITITQQNTAALDTANIYIKAQQAEITKLKKDIATKDATKKILWFVSVGLLLLIVIWVVVKIYGAKTKILAK